MELKCAVQTYEWGKRGSDSIVADFMRIDADFLLDEQKPYAELWMGTHKNGPSSLKDTRVPLQEYIEEDIHVLGDNIVRDFGANLPFLFKVLSIHKALSIQVHPDKEKAKKLHEQYPSVYKDPNYKPELAIALTPFEALCGFRPIEDIKRYMRVLPELRAVIGEDNALSLLKAEDSAVTDALKACFEALMTCSHDSVMLNVTQLLERFMFIEKKKLLPDEACEKSLNIELLRRLHADFPGDVGCFAIYLLDYITLQPGEAVYIPPNVAHAYISGDCVECMACSDNVIRAGLTPKPKDLPTLLQSLTFEYTPLSDRKLLPCQEDAYTEVFRPSVPEFAVAKITIPAGQASYKLIPRSSASILVIVDGKIKVSSRIFGRGSALFVSANEELSIESLNSSQPLLMFQAFANI